MAQIGVIVDGQGDYHSVRSRFLGQCRVLKSDGPRGHQASIDNIVAGATKQIAMLEGCKCSPIVVLIDFEMRTEDYDVFAEKLAGKFRERYTECNVKVSVPNRMIENWYLADIEYLSMNKAFLKNNIRQRNFEGTNGKEQLKKMFRVNYSYSETIHGPQLFSVLRFEVARSNSSSFSNFLIVMEGENN